MGFSILIGMVIGIISWEIGKAIAERTRRKHGCYDRCYHCGKPPFELL